LIVKTNEKEYEAKRVILCIGMLNVPAKHPVLEKHKDKNVHYKIGSVSRFKGKKVVCIGGGDNAFDTALQLSAETSEVTILVKHSYAKAKEKTVEDAIKKGIKISYNSELIDIIRSDLPGTKIKIRNNKTQEIREMITDEIFSAIGFSPINSFLSNNGIKQNEDGSVFIDDNYETSVKGVFAAGDITGEIKLLAVASAEGIEAAIHAFSSIKKPYWLK
ncbi:NAD(P)/FAD-dependent oxidoreductase, partial [Candidatus Woesearchaeota archaeon]|nr:NAD(P)/FAD-dependent oxidoreductase [Candidatus Woesearchaeota archaeon]